MLYAHQEMKHTVDGPTRKLGYISRRSLVTTRPNTVSPRCSYLQNGSISAQSVGCGVLESNTAASQPKGSTEERNCSLFIVWTRVLWVVLEHMIRASIIRAMRKDLCPNILLVDIRERRKWLIRIEHWMQYGWWTIRQ
jgi:hypothetical protein